MPNALAALALNQLSKIDRFNRREKRLLKLISPFLRIAM
jgi:dTDP-4-amino-4,6-dideoxygalactose transaminase